MYAGNFVGAVVTALLAFVGGVQEICGGQVGQILSLIGSSKAGLDPVRAIALGILCNALVCLAIWLTLAGHSVTDKLLAVALPVAAFVALGFEHCVANMLFLPFALLLDGGANSTLLAGSVRNLAFVTLGNAIGGTILVAGVYWLAYLREARR